MTIKKNSLVETMCKCLYIAKDIEAALHESHKQLFNIYWLAENKSQNIVDTKPQFEIWSR